MTDDIQLPGLPEVRSYREYGLGYNEDDMEAYARAAVLADRERATVKESVTVQDERAAFEAWCVTFRDSNALPYFIMRSDDGEYIDHGTRRVWDAWQARAALAPVADKLAEALRHFANNYLLDEYDDEELCIDHKHHSAVVALFDALAEYDRQRGGE